MPPGRPEKVTPENVNADASLTPATRITRDLVKLPPPKFKIPVAVYAFRDQTGQFKPQPDSNLSNAVTQGAASILVKALLDSGWYLPAEREGFQNLLNERRVARAIEVPTDNGKPGSSYPALIPAQYIMEGGIVGYESNVRTGGVGASLLGVGGETKYRVDQVTVNLRSVDVRSGQVVNSVSVTKTIFSREVSASVYQFVTYKTLLQAEGGYSSNEPSQLAVKEAIESAVIHLTLQGISNRVWSLKNDQDWYRPVVQSYVRESELQLAEPEKQASIEQSVEPLHMREAVLVKPASVPLHMQMIEPGQKPAVLAAAPVSPASQAAPAAAPTTSPAPAATVVPPVSTVAVAPAEAPTPAEPSVVAKPAPVVAPAPAMPAAPVAAKPVPAAPVAAIPVPAAPSAVQSPAPVAAAPKKELPKPGQIASEGIASGVPSSASHAGASASTSAPVSATSGAVASAGRSVVTPAFDLVVRQPAPPLRAPASGILPEVDAADDILPQPSSVGDKVACHDCG